MIIYLYIKEHSVTGLKYFGKTISTDPFKYSGSGTYWVPHIKKYGKELVKTLEVWGFDNQELCTEFALRFSKENNIVESKEWANRIPENGLPSTFQGSVLPETIRNRISNTLSGRTISEEHRLKNIRNLNIPEIAHKRTNTQKNNQIGIFNPEVRALAAEKSKSQEATIKKKNKFNQIKHQQGSKNSQFGTCWITNDQINKKIPKNEELPPNWRYGRV